MAKLAPIQGIMSELKKHCNEQTALEAIMPHARSPFEKLNMEEMWRGTNVVIAKFCELLKIIEVPKEQISEVLAGLKDLQDHHGMIWGTIEELSKELPQS